MVKNSDSPLSLPAYYKAVAGHWVPGGRSRHRLQGYGHARPSQSHVSSLSFIADAFKPVRIFTVFRIRIPKFLGHPDPEPLETCTDPDPSIIKQK
jgi:hypothetical protein